MKPYQVEMPSLNFRKLSENHPPFQMDEIIYIKYYQFKSVSNTTCIIK